MQHIKRSTFSAIKAVLLLVGVIWTVEFLNGLIGHRLNVFGIFPRRLESLPGILFWPLLHGGYGHLIVNTTPLLVMGFFVALRGVRTFVFSSLLILILAGLGVWLFGRPAFHIGASGLVFGYFGFLVALAWFERSLFTFSIACLVLFYYGGIIFGILPRDEFVSWEGHLFGLLAGIVAANLFARKSIRRSLKSQ
ncbi:MAG: membrane associated rhomboid family serine protease [Candidatus Azotimanducaceae bacterium]|jgi:membrane associated rhomboid family serine protease